MDELSSKARSLLAAGRAADRPSPADRARIAENLRGKLGSAALSPKVSTSASPLASDAVSTVGSKIVLALVVGLCMIGGGLFFALRPSAHSQKAPSPSSSASPANAPPVAGSTPTSELPNPPLVASADSAAESPAPTATPAIPSARSDRLAQEVALLSRATSALRAGRSAEALVLLNEHQHKFPNGILSEERRAAKAQALCSLGRQSEGRAELSHLTPTSPAAIRAQQACGSAKPQ